MAEGFRVATPRGGLGFGLTDIRLIANPCRVVCTQELMTPLMMGLETPHLNATAALLESAFLSLDIDQLEDDEGRTALDIATRDNHTDILVSNTWMHGCMRVRQGRLGSEPARAPCMHTAGDEGSARVAIVAGSHPP